MLKKIKDSLKLIKQVLSKKKYSLIFLISSIILFTILYKFTVATVANQDLGIFVMMSGVNATFINLMTLIIISILFGIFLALFWYKINLIRKVSKAGFFGFLGLIIGAFAAGCPTCGAFLFSLIGMPLALMYFPFKGLELKLLSIVFILISIYLISRSLEKCEMNKCKI
jgi:hypothetical protein